MKESDLKEIKSARPTNISRVACAIIFIIIYFTHSFQLLAFFAFIQLSLSLFWIWLIERNFKTYKSNPSLWYMPASIDIFFLTACVYITGISYSPVLLGYVLLTCMSSADLIRARGLYTTIGSCVSYLLLILLAIFDIVPIMNITNDTSIPISNFSAILSSLLLVIACFTANLVIFQIHFQLKERNSQLSNSLDKINLLKLQQDADYALTARLMEPFTGNIVESKNVSIEYYLQQKKSFVFRNQTLEIGGDILIADEVFFNGRKFILLLNGDAMGKSMQGACGALVLGAICKSFIANVKSKSFDINTSPEDWLINSISQMQSIFESFDGSMLMSVFLGLLEDRTGRLYFINAEHPEPILYRDEEVSFLENNFKYRKIGTLGLGVEFLSIDSFQLKTGDTLFVGSDGKDDIILHATDQSERKINDDEFLFPSIIKNENGNLLEIAKSLKKQGELIDDLSILKISYLK